MIGGISMVFVIISPFAFVILLIWVFSFLILVRLARGLTILFIFSKYSHLYYVDFTDPEHRIYFHLL
jgi:hypothetical protein